MKTALLPLFSVAALVAVPAFPAVSSHINRVFNVSGGARVLVNLDMGDVEVRAGGAGRVGVQILRTVSTRSQDKANDLIDDFTYDVRQSGDTISVRIDNKNNSWFSWGLGPQLKLKTVITVPRNSTLDLATSGGDIDVAGVDGVVAARTSGGDIDLVRLAGPVKATTSGGDITARELRSRVEVATSGGDILIDGAPAGVSARTSGGDVTVRRAGGDIIAKTSGGDIDLEGVDGAVEAKTSGGDVVARLTAAPRRDVHLSTSGGGVRLVVPAHSGFELDAESSGGDVSSNLPVLVSGKRDDDSLVGRVNAGGPRVRLRSSAGDIVITTR